MINVCFYARFQSNTKESHLSFIKRILRYLLGTKDFGLWYPKNKSFDLVGHSNVDFEGRKLDRKSTSGNYQILGNCLVSWNSKKQTLVAPSIVEAMYM